MNVSSVRSIARRFLEARKFRNKLSSLKKANFCRRHLRKRLGDELAYEVLVRAYCAFLTCTYAQSSEGVRERVALFVSALNVLVARVGDVAEGKLDRVPGGVVALVGSSATELRKYLRGTLTHRDCRDDWVSFGLIYHAIF